VQSEVKKVDGIRGYLKHCAMMEKCAKEERDAQAKRAKTWEGRRERLSKYVVSIMQGLGIKKLEGRTGTLAVHGNGGVQPFEITNAELLPPDCVTRRMVARLENNGLWSDAELTITGTPQAFTTWKRASLDAILHALGQASIVGDDTPNNDAIREAMTRGKVSGVTEQERGSHLRVG
jgi:hypothetical protein